MTYRCLHGQAPRYLADHVTPAIKVASRRRLLSANRHQLIVPRCRLNTYGRRAFRLLVRRSGTHCQMNSEIRRVMSTASNSSLEQSCSALTSVTSALEVIFNVMRSINPRFTYLLTYKLTIHKCLLTMFARTDLSFTRYSWKRVRTKRVSIGLSQHISSAHELVRKGHY